MFWGFKSFRKLYKLIAYWASFESVTKKKYPTAYYFRSSAASLLRSLIYPATLNMNPTRAGLEEMGAISIALMLSRTKFARSLNLQVCAIFKEFCPILVSKLATRLTDKFTESKLRSPLWHFEIQTALSCKSLYGIVSLKAFPLSDEISFKIRVCFGYYVLPMYIW